MLARATELAAQGRDIINLGIGQPDFRTPDHIVEAAIKALRDGHHGYTPATGILPLREAVAADLHKRFGVEVSPDEVMIMPGGKPTMFMSILMFGEPGADILYPDPGFPIYRSMIEFTGAQAGAGADPRGERLCLLGRGDAEADHAEDAAADPQLAGQPDRRRHAEEPRSTSSSPGWRSIPTSRSCRTRSTTRWSMTASSTSACSIYPSIRDRLILLNGWSKTYAMTGWRLGYAVWPGKLYDYARKLAVNLHSCVNAPAQYAGLAALTGPQDAVAHDGRRVRQAPEDRGRGPEQAARRLLRHAEGRVLRLPQHQAHRLEGEEARLGAA